MELFDTITAIIGGIIAFGFFIFFIFICYVEIRSKIESKKAALKRIKEARNKYNIGDVVLFIKDSLFFLDPYWALSHGGPEQFKGYIVGFRGISESYSHMWELRILNQDGEKFEIPVENIVEVIGHVPLSKVLSLNEKDNDENHFENS